MQSSREDDFAGWVARLRKGDVGALEQIIERTQKRLFAHCYLLCGNAAKAEELAQDVYLKTFESIKDLKNPEGLLTWMFTIARRHFIDQTRSAEFKLEKLESHEDDDAPLLSFLPSQDSGQSMEDALLVRETLARMNPENRHLLLIVFQGGFSGAEAAEVLGISEGALRVRLHRARKEFVTLYGKSGGGSE